MKKRSKKLTQLFVAAMTAVFVTSAAGGPLVSVWAAGDVGGDTGITDDTSVPSYLDQSLSFEERAADLVSRMTLEEKQSQLKARTAAAIPRLGVRAYDWWSEALHGVARSGEATSFPTGLGIASTWNKGLVNEMMTATSDEARAYTNEKGKGLSYWSPTINMARDPRWGRAEETFGEDPYLTAQIAENFINGLQGASDDTKYLKAIATVKHFAANNSEFNRHSGDAQMDERTLREYYTPAFKDSVENANVQSLMASYNRVNGTPMAANKYMLDTMLRRTWGFDGYVTTDCWALDDFWKDHKWIPEGWDHIVTPTETTALAIQAGTDLNCGDVYASQAINAVNEGILSEDDIDVALTRLFTARMRTGEFDNPEDVPYTSDEYSWENQISAEDHTTIAEQSSDEAVVMLKNDKVEGSDEKLLPLDKEVVDNIVIVGDLADDVILGDYSGSPKESNKSTPVQGLQNLLGEEKVTYIQAGAGSVYGNYNFNIDKFKLLSKDGTELKTLLPKDGAEFDNCRVEDSGNLGWIKNNGYIAFQDVDMKGVGKISADIAAPINGGDARGGSVELHLDSPDGPVVGTIKAEHTGGWQEYKTCIADYKDGGFEGVYDLYFVFKDPVSNIDLTEEEIKEIEDADVVVAYVGTTEGDSAEDRDRSTLVLPRNQADMVNQVAEINPKTVAYMQSVGQVDVEPFKDNVPAIFWCTYNGQAQGNAMARLLFGEANPSGKLPFTWYQDEKELPYIGDYSIRPNAESMGRTYQYFTGKVSYPFGYGLSYSSFEYSNLQVDKISVTPNDIMTVSVDVKNTSDTDGQDVVELYIVSPDAEKNERPAKRLRGFEKVEIKAGETKTVTMEVPVSEFYYWDEENAVETYDLGKYKLQVGNSSEDIQLEQEFTLQGERDVVLQTVKAIPDKTTLDVDKPENKASTKLSATMNDQSFYDLEKADVQYTSSNPEVAVVDENGIVSPVGGGTALITAQVTVDGVSKTSSYPVAVKQQVAANDIQVNGESLTGFKPDVEKYQCVVDADKVPEVTAIVPDGLKVEIKQAEAVPGTATVVVKGGNEQKVYTIEFLTEVSLPEGTDFTKVDSIDQLKEMGWNIVRDNGTDYELTDKGLLIKSLRGDLYQTSNTAKNIFVKETAGDWVAETHITTSIEPNEIYQQAGMLVYGDDDNYVKLCHIKNGTTKEAEMQFGKETGGAWNDNDTKEAHGTDMYLKIQKQGNTYMGFYSFDGGETYTDMGSVEVELKNPKIGLFAMNGEQDRESVSATFSHVSFEKIPAVCTCDLYGLTLIDGTEIPYEVATGDGKELQAQAMKRGGCQVEGHHDSEIEYSYALAENGQNTAEATVEGNILKSVKEGKVDLKLTATWNGVTIEAPASAVVLEKLTTSDLTALIDYAKSQQSKEEYKYVVPVVKEKFEKALADAEAVNAKADATQEEIDAAYAELLKMVHYLDFTGNSESLKVLVDVAKGLNEKLYTPESWNLLKDALTKAERVLSNENALQDEIDAAKDALQNAMDSLVKIPVDKSKLQKLVNDSKKYEDKLDEYTLSTAEIFTGALKNARDILAKEDATQEEVNAAYNALQNAIFGLRLIPDKDKLNELIKEAEKTDFSKYTKESGEAVKNALKQAKAVFADENATEQQIAKAEKDLQIAMDGLKLVSNNENSGNRENSDNSPKTGDDDLLGIYGLLAALAAAGVVFRKNKK